MAQQFANYQDPGQDEPSMAKRLFGSPLKVWWGAQKLSLYKHMLDYDNWAAMGRGEGLNWSGIVGLRRLALGNKAAGSTLGSMSPAHLLTGVLRGSGGISPRAVTAADTLEAKGLFGVEGILNKSNSKLTTRVGKIIGGGTINSSKFGEKYTKLIAKYDERIKYHEEVLNKWSNYKHKNFFKNKKLFRPEDVATETQRKTLLSTAESVIEENTSKLKLAEASKTKIVSKYGYKLAKETKFIRKIALAGKVASFLGMASMAIDIGEAIGGFAAGTADSLATRLEVGLKSLSSTKMDFGGKVGIGFTSGRSGTERQRALSAIGRGYNGSSGMGSEASYSHVDSTW